MNSTLKRNKNLEIERLRAVAVIMVTVAHGVFSYFLPEYMVNPYTGVDIFFVISGFVVTLSFLKLIPKFSQNESLSVRLHKAVRALKIFYTKRVFRIFPLAIFWLFVYWLLAVIFTKVGGGGNFSTPDIIMREVVGVLSGTYNYLVKYGLSGNIAHYWSLSVEEQFYALLPLFLIFSISKKKRLKLLSLILVVLVFFVPFLHSLTSIATFKYIHEQRYFNLIFGVIIALFYRGPSTQRSNSTLIVQKTIHSYFKNILHENKLLVNKLARLVVNGVKFLFPFTLITVIWILPGLMPGNTNVHLFDYGYALVGLFASVLVILASKETGWILNIPYLRTVLEYIGARSYCIYLSHFAFVRLKPTVLTLFYYHLPEWLKTSNNGIFIQNACVWIGIIIVSEICFRVIEKPMIEMGSLYVKEGLSK